MIGIDYMGGALNVANAKADGVVLCLRYIAPASWGWPKALTPGELTSLTAAGFVVQPIWESNTNNPLGGSAQGTADGQAVAQAFRDLHWTPKYLAVAYDQWIDPAQFPTCLAYAQALYDVFPAQQIPYGESALIAYLQHNAPAITAGGWVCGSASFPHDSSAVLWLSQRVGGLDNIGVSNDIDDILVPYFQEVPEVSAYTVTCPPGPNPTTIPLVTPGKDCTSGTLSFATDVATAVELYVGAEGSWRDPGWHTSTTDQFATVVPAGRTLSCPLVAGDQLAVVYNKGTHEVVALVVFQ